MTLTAPVGLVCEFFIVTKFVSISVTKFSSVGSALTETAMGVQLIFPVNVGIDEVLSSPPTPIPPSLPTSFPIPPFPRRTMYNEIVLVRTDNDVVDVTRENDSTGWWCVQHESPTITKAIDIRRLNSDDNDDGCCSCSMMGLAFR